MQATDLSSTGRKAFANMEFDKNEKLLYEIRKHPFGLFLIYLGGTALILLMLSLAVAGAVLQGDPVGIGAGATGSILIATGLLLAIMALVGVAIQAYIYQAAVVLVTSDKISQMLYRTILDRTISQLSIGDVQDVSVRQQGLFPRIFDYGTLVVETSGEQNNYVFTFTPQPHQAAKAIQAAHEDNLKLYGN